MVETRSTMHFLCHPADIRDGQIRSFRVGARSIAVARKGDRYFAVRNVCPHHGAELSCGVVTGTIPAGAVGEFCWERDGEILRCPWHGWEFDLLTGRSVNEPERYRVRAYPVVVQEDGVYLDMAGRA
jgi:nitrite reductase (NADH) small subunit